MIVLKKLIVVAIVAANLFLVVPCGANNAINGSNQKTTEISGVKNFGHGVFYFRVLNSDKEDNYGYDEVTGHSEMSMVPVGTSRLGNILSALIGRGFKIVTVMPDSADGQVIGYFIIAEKK